MTRIRSLATLPVMPLALLVSLLFSLLLTATHPLLNDDAFSYLRAAERFQDQGLASMLQEYGWYGYSVLVSLGDAVLPGGLVASAQILNALFYLILTGSFIALQREFGAAQRQLWLAAAVVLLFPLVNEMRYFIIRDVACWAFMLLGLLQLVHQQREPGITRALAWSACTLLAALFRLEALLSVVLVPIAILCASPSRAAGSRILLQLYGSLLACSLLLLALAWAAGVQLPELILFAGRYYLPQLFDLGAALRSDALALNAVLFTSDNFPGTDNLGVGLLIIVFANFSSVLLNLVGALGLPFTLLLLLAWRQRCSALPRTALLMWRAYAAAALLALLVFQFTMHFQTQRYATLLSLLLLLLLPGCIDHWWRQAERQGWVRRFRVMLGVFCFYLAADSLVSFGYSRQHLVQAEQWLLEELPADASLATNSYQLAWRSGRIPDYDRITRALEPTVRNNPNAEYLVLVLKQADATARARLDGLRSLALVTRFSNERGDEVRIYQRQPPGSSP